MAGEMHGLDACVFIDGTELVEGSGFSLAIASEKAAVIRFSQSWRETLKGVMSATGSLTLYHNQDAKTIADAALSASETTVLLYPDCDDTTTYYSFLAWFDFEHTADVGAAQTQTAPFEADGAVTIAGFAP